MADNGKLQFFGQTVYPQTLSTNILNPDGTPAPVLPVPSSATAGQVPVVNAAGNGYELQTQSSGGITQSTVIERSEELPTATADSPDFVEVGGVLYRKKAVEGGSLIGTWVFNKPAYLPLGVEYILSFTSNGNSYSKMSGHTGPDWEPEDELYYDDTLAGAAWAPEDELYLYYDDTLVSTKTTWANDAYKTIQITDISSLINEAEFTSWLTANATKQGGGGGTVTYSYVALADA